MIGLRTFRSTYVDDRALHSTMRFLEGRRYRAVSCQVDENNVWRAIAVKPNKTQITRLEREV